MPRATKRAATARVTRGDTNLQASLGTPFPVFSEQEGDVYHRLLEKGTTQPRHFDWDLTSTLHVRGKLVKYLKNLHADKLAESVWPAYNEIALEMIVSYESVPGSYDIRCRFMGREVRITLDMMHAVFGFSKSSRAAVCVPGDFDSHSVWYELSGFHNWDPSGTSNGFLKDNALLFLHKFLAYNISGKKEANKITNNELYLLWAAKHGKEVCLSTFLFSALESTNSRSRSHAAFAQFATGLARHLELLPPNPDMTEVPSVPIAFSEMKNAHLINDENQFVPHQLRRCVRRQIAIDRGDAVVPPDDDTAPSTSIAQTSAAMDTDIGAEEAAYEAPPSPPPSYTAHGSQPAYGYPGFQADFASFQTQLFQRLDGYDARFDAQDARLSSIQTSIDAYGDRLSALEQRWNQWTGLYPPHPPFPHHDDSSDQSD